MPGLKGLRASGRGGGAGCDSRAPCPALPALHGMPCARAAHGALPAPAPRAPGRSRAPMPASPCRRVHLGPSLAAPATTGGCGAEMALPRCCLARGCAGGLRRAPACVATSHLLTRGVCI